MASLPLWRVTKFRKQITLLNGVGMRKTDEISPDVHRDLVAAGSAIGCHGASWAAHSINSRSSRAATVCHASSASSASSAAS
ncbi:hypothetical protein EV132_1299 [Rhizobium sullae]|uniref:Uncharacterized protein n=1 Tax=Rhizobium sullae TaxID=50338 RepID=A0A4V2V7Y2_RHISU|nr:hypothetical protein EV132_1299 [Rhizobium sullae]